MQGTKDFFFFFWSLFVIDYWNHCYSKLSAANSSGNLRENVERENQREAPHGGGGAGRGLSYLNKQQWQFSKRPSVPWLWLRDLCFCTSQTSDMCIFLVWVYSRMCSACVCLALIFDFSCCITCTWSRSACGGLGVDEGWGWSSWWRDKARGKDMWRKAPSWNVLSTSRLLNRHRK